MARRPSIETIRLAVTAAQGNLTQAAAALGMDRDDVARAVGVTEKRGRPRRELDAARVRRALERAGSQRGAARLLGVPEATLRRFVARMTDDTSSVKRPRQK